MHHDLILLLGMVLATYSVRWVLFGFAQKIVFPEWFKIALAYVPVAVLTALFIPIVLTPKGELWLSIDNPYLISAIVAAVIAWRWKNLLLTISVGLGIFLLLRFFWS
ncbi:MAG: branched-subunit amino acid transport protein [Candidatus Endobugula sp.]|jgi:branched-subunit amino acid transport protein